MGQYRIVNPEKVPNIASSLGLPVFTDESVVSSFDYVGKWRINISPSGFGAAHRIALKRDVYDSKRDKYLQIVHFAVPIAKEGSRMPIELIEGMYQNLNRIMCETAILAGKEFGNLSCMCLATPDSMKKELEEILASTQV